jgi:hypothetical protein
MVSKVIRYKGVLIGKIPDFEGRRRIGSDNLSDMLWNAGRWISSHHGLEVILPDRLLLVVCMRRPVACLVPEIDDRDASFLNGPGNIRDDLLNERE